MSWTFLPREGVRVKIQALALVEGAELGLPHGIEVVMSLEKCFLSSSPITSGSMVGRYVVRALGPNASSFCFFRHRKVIEINGNSVSGYNEFLGVLRLGCFKASLEHSLNHPNLEVLRIDYAQPENPFFLKRLVDEVREVSPGVWLGQGLYLIQRKWKTLIYFTMTREL